MKHRITKFASISLILNNVNFIFHH